MFVATSSKSQGPLVVILGETASGKSALAMELAERFEGEVICADSRTVYKGMNIGTAKPSPRDQKAIRHHCIDLVLPNERFTVADFKKHALDSIFDITARGKLPIMVGGTGLYIDAVVYDFQFRPPVDSSVRAELRALSVTELQDRLVKEGIPLPNNPQNPRHLARALESGGAPSERRPLREQTLLAGIKLEREEIIPRIRARVEAMLSAGLETEVASLVAIYGWDAPGLQTIGYREWHAYFEGRQTFAETKDLILKNTLQYAKRQRTWYRRNNSIHWFSNREDITMGVVIHTAKLNK